jgi:hypothetical protein
MVGDLASSIGLDDWDVTRIQNVLSFSRLSLGKDWRMLHQPDFRTLALLELGDFGLHFPMRFCIRLSPTIEDDHLGH